MPDKEPLCREISYAESLALPQPYFIDVRSESEYAEDHLPGAVNLPVLDDAERAETGLVYHRLSQQEARLLGLELISAKLPRLMRELLQLAESGRPLVLYCWRGGLRSQAVAAVAELMRIPCLRLSDGYRGYRRWLSPKLEAPFPFPVIVLHGLTGCGKTRILLRLKQDYGLQVADLEGLANHRGSVFGSVGLGAQPSQKYFQTQLWQELWALDLQQPLLVECESRRIGNIVLDAPLFEAMQQGGHLLVYDTVAGRAKRLVEDYAPEGRLAEILQALHSPPLCKRISQVNREQLEKQLRAGAYEEFTAYLLTHYYDPLYHYPAGPDAQYDLSVCSADEAAAAAQIAAYVRALGKPGREGGRSSE